jgi:primosomal protein N'
MALNLLYESVDFSVIATIDSLFSIPDFRIRERIFHILLQARSLAREKFIIQARNAERETLEMAISGSLFEFYKREIKERELLKYPPFSTFVKVTVRGTRTMVLKEAELLSKIFERWNPVIFESGAERHEAPSAVNCVIKLDTEEYPKSSLYSTLISLPPYFEIKINPDNLL